MGFRIVVGTIKNNTGEEYLNYLDGIRVMCGEFPKGYWSVLGGCDDENQEKYKRAAWEHMGKEDGYKTYEEFEKIYTESDDYGAGLAMENLIDIEEIVNVDLDKYQKESEIKHERN